MKKQCYVRMSVIAVTICALLSLGLAGCDQNKKDATAVPATPAVEQAKAAEHPATDAPAAATDPAKAKPKDHPAH